MSRFNEFWELAKQLRQGLGGNYPRPAAIQFHKALKEGESADDIINGMRNYLATDAQNVEPQYQPSAAKWLAGWAWMNYQEALKVERPLTREEQRSYELAFRTPPRRTLKGPDEWAGLTQ